MHLLNLTHDAYDFVKSLQAKQYRQVVSKILELTKNPTPVDAAKLKGFDFFRVDIGEYRIIYRFDNTTVYIALVGKRNDDEVYKQLKQK